MADHNDLGRWGEQVAVTYLQGRGYSLLGRNCRCGHLELDIVAAKGDEVAFVEVKTRTTDQVQRPEEAVNRRKIARLVRAADAYMQQHCIDGRPRFDVLTVVGTPGDFKVEHLEHAFEVPLC